MVEGVDGVELDGAVTEGVVLPEVDAADEDEEDALLPARMYGAHNSKNDNLRNFGAISL